MLIILSKFGCKLILIFISCNCEFLGYYLCDPPLFLGKVRGGCAPYYLCDAHLFLRTLRLIHLLFLCVTSVQTALFDGRFFPPPATFAFVLVRQYRLRTRFATNAYKTAFVQLVVRHIQSANVFPNLCRRPVC